MLTVPLGIAEDVRRRLTPEPERPLPTDPVEWVRTVLDEYLWSVQVEILRALQEHRKVAVASCHGIGKSYTASRATAHWIAGHPPGEAKAVTTAPSGHQVRSILWSEIAKAHARGGLPGHITRGGVPEWVIGGEQVAFGRKPQDFVNAEQAMTVFQGIHARYLLGVLDEAAGIPSWLVGAMEALITNESSRLLAIGNPTDPTSEFARMCEPGSGWHVITVSAFQSPNFTREYVPEQLRDSLVSRLWVEEIASKYGEDSAYYISRVLGEFPDVADDVIITPRMVREAWEHDRSGMAIEDPGRFGLDVARHGKDETALYLNRGGMIRLVDSWRGLDTTASAKRVKGHLDALANGNRPINIDTVGLGWGVFDPLRDWGYKVEPFNGGEKANEAERFENANAESWWAMRKAMEAGLIDLDPADEELAAQLQSRKWREDPSEKRIRVEKKEDMAKRGLSSPDRADAAILSFYRRAGRVGDPAVILGARDLQRQREIEPDLMTLPT